MRVEIVKLTPEMAKTLLAHNTGNRPESKATVQRYVNEMAAGRWSETGETISFDVNGKLINGQHRLRAVAETGVTIEEQILAWDVPEAAFAVLDCGKARSAADALKMEGLKNANEVGQAIRLVIGYSMHGTLDYKKKISTAEQVLFLNAHPEIIADVDGIMDMDNVKRLKPGILGGLRYLARSAEHGTVMFDRFLEDVITGLGLKSGNPAACLRNHAMGEASLNLGNWTLCLVVGWNRYAAGKSMSKLSFGKSDTLTLLKVSPSGECDTSLDKFARGPHTDTQETDTKTTQTSDEEDVRPSFLSDSGDSAPVNRPRRRKQETCAIAAGDELNFNDTLGQS